MSITPKNFIRAYLVEMEASAIPEELEAALGIVLTCIKPQLSQIASIKSLQECRLLSLQCLCDLMQEGPQKALLLDRLSEMEEVIKRLPEEASNPFSFSIEQFIIGKPSFILS